MPRKDPNTRAHSGRTDAGNTRDLKVERVGKVTIYKRGETYSVYYRQGGISLRRKVDGNLAAARATAHKILTSLDENRPSQVDYARTSPTDFVSGYLAFVADVQKLSLWTHDRYRAALERLLDFCRSFQIGSIDAIEPATVERFVGWLRSTKRARNGSAKGKKKDAYQLGGVKFILSTCRTAFAWAMRRRMLPPFSENAFASSGMDRLKDRRVESSARVFSAEQERAFFAACDDWQRPLFSVLASYGLRVGELTHLQVEDVDWTAQQFVICSKPWLYWFVKTGRERRLPLVPATLPLFRALIGDRTTGFVCLNRETISRRSKPRGFADVPNAFRRRVELRLGEFMAANPDANERQQKKVAVNLARDCGQIPERRMRSELMKLTETIGCPEYTRVHDLRHLFTTRAQSAGVNPLVVQEMLGHTTLEMTKRYSHFGIEDRREALSRATEKWKNSTTDTGVSDGPQTKNDE